MRIIKNTSRYNTQELEHLASFIRGIDHRRIDVVMTDTTRCLWRGWAPYKMFGNRDPRYRITLRLCAPENFPCTSGGRYKRSPPEFMVNDWREAFIIILAHELRHIQQYRCGWRGKREVDAEKFAFKMLKRYRRDSQCA